MDVIEPYTSAGGFKFGASYNEVVSALGEPCSTERSRLGETIVRYDGFGATISSRGVVEVYFLPGVDVSLLGFDVFGDAAAFGSLCILDGDPKEFMGFIILFKLGVTMTGFHDGDAAQQAITAFEKGRWDRLLGEMQEYQAASC
ncbi:hypothetical protein OMP43_22630 [Sphingomonas sp. CBMAI 2297]|uniref:hypothetical protein n=1 Tax=Sphingomonas sp. CBMAI 2297 TaxID=2991720 RepID=UPI00245454B0|nr:hypothetical protein [Sphingomonas sp. CBMAI 2297]MDH4746830.1 hypothetical protein [Sphingomonas sp. CBMAI 2297]